MTLLAAQSVDAPAGRRSGREGGTLMGLRALLIATAVIFVAVQAGADTADEVGRSVRAIQAAFDQGDVETLRGLLTEDHVSTLTYAHFSSAAELLKALSDYQFSEYTISETLILEHLAYHVS